MASDVLQAKPEMKTIAPLDLAQLRSEGRARDLIDVRTPVEFAAVHAQDAISVPLDRLDPHAVLSRRADGPGEPLYLICKSGARATRACERFAAAGITNVVCVTGGTDAWEASGLPVVRSRNIIPLERQALIGAGTLVLLGVSLGYLVHPLFFSICAVPGCGLILAGTTNICLMAMLLAKAPWNRGFTCDGASAPR
jgi:rhodanese-related sulfurtransferase